MKFLIKQISPSRKELRITLNPIEVDGTSSYRFGSIGNSLVGLFETGVYGGQFKMQNLPYLSGFVDTTTSSSGCKCVISYI